MNLKLCLVGVVCLTALPSCMHPVEQVLNANVEAKQRSLIATGSVSQGACDDIGQYIARNTDGGERLTLQPSPEQASAYMLIR